MKRILWIAAVVVLTAAVALPTLALPKDCSCSRCAASPGIVCAVPGQFRVVYCSEYLEMHCFWASASAPAEAASLDEFLDHLASQPVEPASQPAPQQVTAR